MGDPDLIMLAVFAGLTAGIPGEEALVWAERAMGLNSKPPDWYWSALAVGEFFAGNYPAARHAAACGAASSALVVPRRVQLAGVLRGSVSRVFRGKVTTVLSVE